MHFFLEQLWLAVHNATCYMNALNTNITPLVRETP